MLSLIVFLFSSSEEDSASDGDSSSSGEEDEALEQPSSDENEEEEISRRSKMASLARPTLQLPGGFRWDVGVVKTDSGVGGAMDTSSESEEEDEQQDEVNWVNCHGIRKTVGIIIG